jgi:hypothetical protein
LIIIKVAVEDLGHACQIAVKNKVITFMVFIPLI